MTGYTAKSSRTRRICHLLPHYNKTSFGCTNCIDSLHFLTLLSFIYQLFNYAQIVWCFRYPMCYCRVNIIPVSVFFVVLLSYKKTEELLIQFTYLTTFCIRIVWHKTKHIVYARGGGCDFFLEARGGTRYPKNQKFKFEFRAITVTEYVLNLRLVTRGENI